MSGGTAPRRCAANGASPHGQRRRHSSNISSSSTQPLPGLRNVTRRRASRTRSRSQAPVCCADAAMLLAMRMTRLRNSCIRCRWPSQHGVYMYARIAASAVPCCPTDVPDCSSSSSSASSSMKLWVPESLRSVATVFIPLELWLHHCRLPWTWGSRVLRQTSSVDSQRTAARSSLSSRRALRFRTLPGPLPRRHCVRLTSRSVQDGGSCRGAPCG